MSTSRTDHLLDGFAVVDTDCGDPAAAPALSAVLPNIAPWGSKARRWRRRARPIALAAWTASTAARPAAAPLTPAGLRGHRPRTGDGYGRL